jgi:hypothetical protein
MGAMSVRDELSGTAAGLVSALAIAGGAIIVSIGGLLLGSHITVMSGLVAIFLSALFSLAAASLAALSEGGNVKPKD